MTIGEIKDGLQLTRLRKAELRKAAPGLRQAHLRDCLLAAQLKKDKEKTKAIKDRIQREHNKRMWATIKKVVKDPPTRSVVKVERLENGWKIEYITQEEVEEAIKTECSQRFTLAHSAPIMNSLLGERLRYLADDKIAKEIITGTYEIPEDIDPATKLILKEIGEMGKLMVTGINNKIKITPEELRLFWK